LSCVEQLPAKIVGRDDEAIGSTLCDSSDHGNEGRCDGADECRRTSAAGYRLV
jgi:hypothetical protein